MEAWINHLECGERRGVCRNKNNTSIHTEWTTGNLCGRIISDMIGGNNHPSQLPILRGISRVYYYIIFFFKRYTGEFCGGSFIYYLATSSFTGRLANTNENWGVHCKLTKEMPKIAIFITYDAITHIYCFWFAFWYWFRIPTMIWSWTRHLKKNPIKIKLLVANPAYPNPVQLTETTLIYINIYMRFFHASDLYFYIIFSFGHFGNTR